MLCNKNLSIVPNSFIHATLLRLISIFGWIDAIKLRSISIQK